MKIYGIAATICIGRDIQCLPYAGFLLLFNLSQKSTSLNLIKTIFVMVASQLRLLTPVSAVHCMPLGGLFSVVLYIREQYSTVENTVYSDLYYSTVHGFMWWATVR